MARDNVSVAAAAVYCYLSLLLATLLSPISDVSLFLPIDF